MKTLSCSGHIRANVGSNSVTENMNSVCVALAGLFLYKVVFNFIPFTDPFFLASERSTLIGLTWRDLKQLSVLL